MPTCPACASEMPDDTNYCTACGAALTGAGDAPVVVLQAATPLEARVAAATLQTEGITAFVPPSTVVLPQDLSVVTAPVPELLVMVPAEQAAAARAILAAPAPTEEELTEVEESQS